MFDDLAAYFHENVVSSYVAYLDVRNKESFGISKDLRAAIIAATALFHLREYVPAPHKKSRSEVAKACPDYNILGDVVNASKHRELDRGQPQLKAAEDVYEMTVITQYEDENGPYSGARKLVMVKLNDGSEHDMMDCVNERHQLLGQRVHAIRHLEELQTVSTATAPRRTIRWPRRSKSARH